MYKHDAMRELLDGEGLDAVIACTSENVYYLIGFAPVVKVLNPYRGVCWAIVTAEAPAIVHVVHSHGESDQILDASAEVGLTELYGTFYREVPAGTELDSEEARLVEMAAHSPMGRSPADAIGALIDKLGLADARVAIDEDGVDRELGDMVARRFPAMTMRDGSAILGRLRRVKSAAETARLAAAARCVEAAILAAAANAQVGMSEIDLARHFECALVTGGARPSLTMLRAGRHAVFGQRRQTGDVKIQQGDLLWFDCDAVREMYWADVARVFTMGSARRHEQRFAALREGQTFGIDAIRPGMTGGQVFELVMDVVHRAGFPGYRRHHIGHGIGLEPYERPILAPGNTDVVEAGMVLSIETPFYEYGLGALHVEDPIWVGPDGNTRLTLFDTGLQAINS